MPEFSLRWALLALVIGAGYLVFDRFFQSMKRKV